MKNFVNEKVSHKSLGQGTIVELNDDHIRIRFNSDDNDKIRTFPFPEIFNNKKKLMTTASKVILDYILNFEETHCCSCCEQYSNDIKFVAGKRCCPQCVEKMIKCQHCEGVFEQQDCKSDSYKNNFCKTCYKATHFICAICNNELSNDEIITSSFIYDGKPICESCAEYEFFTCEVCGTWISEEVCVKVENNYMCPNCAKEQTIVCKQCGKSSIKRSDEINICYDCETLELYFDYISSLDLCKLSSYTVSFYDFRRSKTRKIMSRLRHGYGDNPVDPSSMPFDVLLLDTYIGKLVVVWKMLNRFKFLYEHGCTLTKLKKDGTLMLHHFTNTVKKIATLSNGESFHIWERPYQLRAQTVCDMDYGDRWEGRDLIYEGNKYGDTSTFYIIGHIKGA